MTFLDDLDCKWCNLSPCHCIENTLWPAVRPPATTPPPNYDAEVLASQERYRRYCALRLEEDEAFREEVESYNQQL